MQQKTPNKNTSQELEWTPSEIYNSDMLGYLGIEPSLDILLDA